LHWLFLVSAASDVDPSNIGGLRKTEPAVADKDAAEQNARDRPEEQPTVVSVAGTTEEDLARDRVGASTPTRRDETERTPPPSSVAEEGDKVATPLLLKKRGPRLQSQ
jgi:hypothetical protein